MHANFFLVEQPKVSNDAAQVWSLSADDILDDDVDVIDDDDLLDEEDLKKPDPASLKGMQGFHSPGKMEKLWCHGNHGNWEIMKNH